MLKMNEPIQISNRQMVVFPGVNGDNKMIEPSQAACEMGARLAKVEDTKEVSLKT